MNLEVGDLVFVRKPKDIEEHPRWISMMDIYDNKIAEIQSIKKSANFDAYIVRLKGFDYNYNARWLEKICDENIDFNPDILELF